MSTALLEITDEACLAWCNKKHAEGVTLNMHWDGGGDSGWVDFQIDGDSTEEDQAFIDFLTEKCYNELDYGSWAGEFSASGDAEFNPTEGAFVGTDYYSEDDGETVECELRIEIPKDLWFDSLEIMIQDEEIDVSVDMIIRNGFKTDAHTAAETALSKTIETQVQEIVNDAIKYKSIEFRSMWEEISLSKSDFTEEGNNVVHIVKEITIGTFQSEDRHIFIPLANEE